MNKNMNKTRNWTVLNLVFYFLTLGVNYLGASGFINNMSQQDVSDKYHTLITPAGFAFSIWGVIYSLLLITLIYFFVKRKESRLESLIQSVSPIFILSCLFNMGWIVAFSYELLGISTILIFAMLFSLMFIIEKIYKMRNEISYTLPAITFSIYGSWVFIATVVNISAFLIQQEWGGFGVSDSIWTIVVLFIAIAFVLLYLTLYKNAVFPASVAWSFIGIYGAYNNGTLSPDMSSIIMGVLLFGIGIFVIAIIFTFIKNGNSIFPKDKSVNY
ncbi:MAG: tryptophan-rich sensory protein [Clostridium sp.]|nr:tryptophan-rich sensory protein [Clostridium sp.]